MTISGGASRVTGMSIAEAQAILEGSPTQEELFGALVTLAQTSPEDFEPALSKAAEILTAQSRTEVTPDQVQTVVDQLLGATESQPDSTGAVPPPPPPDESELDLPSRPPIGVASDFRTERIDPSSTLRSIDRIREPVAARYRAGDEFEWQSKSASEIRRIQRELERAGLLQGYVPGFWDQATANAMAGAMGFANQRGSTWDAVVRELQSMPRQVKKEEFKVPPELRLKPDPAAIDQRVKSEFRQRLGREPTEEELAEYGGHLTAQYGAAQAAAIAMAREAFEAGQEPDSVSSGRAFQSDIGGRSVESATASSEPGSFTQVDPIARFQELFDRRFGAEEQFIEGQEDTRQNMNSVFQSLARMQSLIG